jgi:hypothetical protein
MYVTGRVAALCGVSPDRIPYLLELEASTPGNMFRIGNVHATLSQNLSRLEAQAMILNQRDGLPLGVVAMHNYDEISSYVHLSFNASAGLGAGEGAVVLEGVALFIAHCYKMKRFRGLLVEMEMLRRQSLTRWLDEFVVACTPESATQDDPSLLALGLITEETIARLLSLVNPVVRRDMPSQQP